MVVGHAFADDKAKNMVLNVSEMEAKVREATNDDPWWVYRSCFCLVAANCTTPRRSDAHALLLISRGASSTLMHEIAAG